MDATASIIAVIQVTGTLVTLLRSASQAPSDRRKLLLEANTLLALLTSLQDFVALDDAKHHPDWRRSVSQLETPNGPFDQYRTSLEDLRRKISPQHKLQKTVQTLLWKFTKEDVTDLLSRIERMKSLVVIALEMDHTYVSC